MYTRRQRIIIVGDSGVGKTHFFKTYVKGDTDCSDIASTIGVDFGEKTHIFMGNETVLQFWDTAGRPSFRQMTTSYFRGASAFLLMFDLTRTSTFDNLKGWLHDITVTINRENVQIILIGTKSDLENDREITANMIRQFMEENDITSYHDISCKTGDGIDGLRFTLEKHLVRGTKFIAWEEPEPPSPRQSIWKRLFRWL